MRKVYPQSVMRTHHRADVAFQYGSGAYLVGSDGTRYLDFVSGIAVNSLGHAHPHLTAAIRGQAEKMLHVSNLFRVPEQERLAERLCSISFATSAFFCNSGAEAAEAAIKFARRTHFAEGAPHRQRIVTLKGAFHGRTLAALAATGNPTYMQGFEPMPGGFMQIPLNDSDALACAAGADAAAIMIEPMQAEGGLRTLSREFVQAVNEIRHKSGCLLIVDEVQTGIGRSGEMFAYSQLGLEPDLMMLDKGLGGGVPIGAVVAGERVSDQISAGAHGSTFGGNPLAMAAANAVLDVVLLPGFLNGVRERAAQAGRRASELVSRFPKVFHEVRQFGLLIGMVARVPNTELVADAFDRGLLVHVAGDNVVRLLPPLIVSKSEMDNAFDILEDIARSK